MDVDANGMIRALVDWPSEIPVRGSVWVVRDQWKSIQQQWGLKDVKRSPFGDRRTIDGRFDLGDASVELHQALTPGSIEYTVTSPAAVQTTGVYWFLEVPVETFAGGHVVVGDRQIPLAGARPEVSWIGEAQASSFTVVSQNGRTRVEVRFPASRKVRVQDARTFGEARYQIYTPLIESDLPEGTELSFSAAFSVKTDQDRAPATITVDPGSIRSEFDGFGGNFVYGIDDPTTDVVLNALKLTWARIGVEAAAWEPTNDNGDPGLTDSATLAARDVEGSKLRKRFELDRRLHKLASGRLIASLWYAPEWLYATPMPQRTGPGTIPRDRWDELAECITSYLLHLKDHYGAEPALFSFNESDIGVYLLLSGEEQRDLFKLLGARFEKAGLRTKLLLGDSADLEKGLQQARATLEDRDAMAHVGALAYHPWAGQSEQWAAWAEAAQRHGLMLMTTEMGSDASGWRDGSYNSPLATLRLARKYIQQLRDAGTQVLLEWEWTGDYAMAERNAQGDLALTHRGRFLEALTQTTPTQSVVVESRCDASSITAACIVADDRKSAALHLINDGGSRRVEVRGLPASLALATLFVIDPLTGPATPQHVEAKDGGCSFDLPAGAVATLAFPSVQLSR